jgi:Ni/Co efflux regulator RcnB
MNRVSKPRRKTLPAAAAAAPQTGNVFEHLLHFATFEEAEATLRHLDALWRESRAAGDRAREAHVLEVAREGRRRAQMIAGNRRVAPQKRAEKAEIRQWFRQWLETPDAFFDWLELRKRSPEFVEKFGTAGATCEESARDE